MAKKDKTANKAAEKDDALFEALGKNKKRKKRKVIISIVSVTLAVAIIAALGVGILQKSVKENFASTGAEVLSYEVKTGSISTVVSGSGSLADVDLETVTVPSGVEITEIKVKTNQSVSAGDVLATVNMASVVSAMADLQLEIEELDEDIRGAESDAASTSVYAGVGGRVKAIYASAGESVADVMYGHGALAVISLDGYMALDIETEALSVGDGVTVMLSDSDEIKGTVESVIDGTATVLVTDNGTEISEAVSVFASDGTLLGDAELYVHSPLRVTGYTGTVKSVKTSSNAKVTEKTKLFILEDTSYSANYNSLLRERAELEETLLELLTIKRNGAVLASEDGSVYSVDFSSESSSSVATLSKDEKMSVTISVDEADILSLELGQTVTVSVSSVSEESFQGTLTEINRTSSSSGTYSAVIELEKADGMLSGMTASVSVRIEGVDDAILIPIEALHKTSDGAYVYTEYDEELEEYGGKVDVVTGLENSSYVEIKSGLSVGDTVYYTESSSAPSGFGNIGGGQMPNFSGGQMPDFSGGQTPDFSGGQMPSFSGGSGGERPSSGGFGGNRG